MKLLRLILSTALLIAVNAARTTGVCEEPCAAHCKSAVSVEHEVAPSTQPDEGTRQGNARRLQATGSATATKTATPTATRSSTASSSRKGTATATSSRSAAASQSAASTFTASRSAAATSSATASASRVPTSTSTRSPIATAYVPAPTPLPNVMYLTVSLQRGSGLLVANNVTVAVELRSSFADAWGIAPTAVLVWGIADSNGTRMVNIPSSAAINTATRPGFSASPTPTPTKGTSVTPTPTKGTSVTPTPTKATGVTPSRTPTPTRAFRRLGDAGEDSFHPAAVDVPSLPRRLQTGGPIITEVVLAVLLDAPSVYSIYNTGGSGTYNTMSSALQQRWSIVSATTTGMDSYFKRFAIQWSTAAVTSRVPGAAYTSSVGGMLSTDAVTAPSANPSPSGSSGSGTSGVSWSVIAPIVYIVVGVSVGMVLLITMAYHVRRLQVHKQERAAQYGRNLGGSWFPQNNAHPPVPASALVPPSGPSVELEDPGSDGRPGGAAGGPGGPGGNGGGGGGFTTVVPGAAAVTGAGPAAGLGSAAAAPQDVRLEMGRPSPMDGLQGQRSPGMVDPPGATSRAPTAIVQRGTSLGALQQVAGGIELPAWQGGRPGASAPTSNASLASASAGFAGGAAAAGAGAAAGLAMPMTAAERIRYSALAPAGPAASAPPPVDYDGGMGAAARARDYPATRAPGALSSVGSNVDRQGFTLTYPPLPLGPPSVASSYSAPAAAAAGPGQVYPPYPPPAAASAAASASAAAATVGPVYAGYNPDGSSSTNFNAVDGEYEDYGSMSAAGAAAGGAGGAGPGSSYSASSGYRAGTGYNPSSIAPPPHSFASSYSKPAPWTLADDEQQEQQGDTSAGGVHSASTAAGGALDGGGSAAAGGRSYGAYDVPAGSDSSRPALSPKTDSSMGSVRPAVSAETDSATYDVDATGAQRSACAPERARERARGLGSVDAAAAGGSSEDAASAGANGRSTGIGFGAASSAAASASAGAVAGAVAGLSSSWSTRLAALSSSSPRPGQDTTPSVDEIHGATASAVDAGTAPVPVAGSPAPEPVVAEAEATLPPTAELPQQATPEVPPSSPLDTPPVQTVAATTASGLSDEATAAVAAAAEGSTIGVSDNEQLPGTNKGAGDGTGIDGTSGNSGDNGDKATSSGLDVGKLAHDGALNLMPVPDEEDTSATKDASTVDGGQPLVLDSHSSSSSSSYDGHLASPVQPRPTIAVDGVLHGAAPSNEKRLAVESGALGQTTAAPQDAEEGLGHGTPVLGTAQLAPSQPTPSTTTAAAAEASTASVPGLSAVAPASLPMEPPVAPTVSSPATVAPAVLGVAATAPVTAALALAPAPVPVEVHISALEMATSRHRLAAQRWAAGSPATSTRTIGATATIVAASSNSASAPVATSPTPSPGRFAAFNASGTGLLQTGTGLLQTVDGAASRLAFGPLPTRTGPASASPQQGTAISTVVAEAAVAGTGAGNGAEGEAPAQPDGSIGTITPKPTSPPTRLHAFLSVMTSASSALGSPGPRSPVN